MTTVEPGLEPGQFDFPQQPTSREARCEMSRLAHDPYTGATGQEFVNWPQNVRLSGLTVYRPESLPALAAAIRSAGAEGRTIRAAGSHWSFSDVIVPFRSALAVIQPGLPSFEEGPLGAVIEMSQLNADLPDDLTRILAPGQDGGSVRLVQAGATFSQVNELLDMLSPPRGLATTGGASDQTIAGALSTGTHGGDSSTPSFADHVQAIHLVSVGGTEHWIERANSVTAAVSLLEQYPCLEEENIHYDDALINAVVLSMGSTGVFYSVLIRTVPQFALTQHRAKTSWGRLREIGGNNLEHVTDGAAMAIVGLETGMTEGVFTPVYFTQVAINPYPTPGTNNEHTCWLTNRVSGVQLPAPGQQPANAMVVNGEDLFSRARLEQAVKQKWCDPIKAFALLEWSSNNLSPDVSIAAVQIVDMLASMEIPEGMWSLLNYVLDTILPQGSTTDVSYKLRDVVTWQQAEQGSGALASFAVESAFTPADAARYVDAVLQLVSQYKTDHKYLAGYLSLRFATTTQSLMGLQRDGRTCFVEYALLSGTRGADEFIHDLQRLALGNNGALHWGMCNDVMTADDVRRLYGGTLDEFRGARRTLVGNVSNVFDSVFTERFQL